MDLSLLDSSSSLSTSIALVPVPPFSVQRLLTVETILKNHLQAKLQGISLAREEDAARGVFRKLDWAKGVMKCVIATTSLKRKHVQQVRR